MRLETTLHNTARDSPDREIAYAIRGRAAVIGSGAIPAERGGPIALSAATILRAMELNAAAVVRPFVHAAAGFVHPA